MWNGCSPISPDIGDRPANKTGELLPISLFSEVKFRLQRPGVGERGGLLRLVYRAAPGREEGGAIPDP